MVLRIVKAMFSQSARSKSTQIRIVDVDSSEGAIDRSETPLRLLGDPVRLMQVVINLIKNALKFTYNGTITIKYQFKKFKNELKVSVIDTGFGIDPNDLNKLFEPYRKLSRS
jgi:signal transduction histidine kinase